MTTTGTSLILKTMNAIFWVIFIGLCIKAGAIFFSYLVSIMLNPAAAQDLYHGINLSGLFRYDRIHYSVVAFLIILVTCLKACIGYWVVRIFTELKIEKPFSSGIRRIITRISRIALWTGSLSVLAEAYSNWLTNENVTVPVSWGYGEILFFAGVIYIIALVFDRGIEMQSENELTV